MSSKKTPTHRPRHGNRAGLSPSTDNIADDLNFAERASHIGTGHELSIEGGKAVSGENLKMLKILKKANRPDQVP